jgi:putative ABC transport system substrate-binding protein
MQRRAFIASIVTITALSRVARAQQPERVRRIGVLLPFAEHDPLTVAMVNSFARALGRFGWIEQKNIRIDYRFSENDPERLSAYAAELVGLKPDALLAAIPPAITALRQRTSIIPIVFEFIADPVGQGFVQTLARPGGNITGFASFEPPMMAKWLQLLKDADPKITRVSIIFSPDTAPYAPLLNREIETAAPSFGISVTLAPTRDDSAVEEAAAAEAREPGGSLLALPDSFTTAHRGIIIAAAARGRLPLIGPTASFPREGALLSYFVDPIELQAEAASYIDRILRGASPADLPVQYPTRYSLVINLKTAKTIGIAVPQSLLQRADDVIE